MTKDTLFPFGMKTKKKRTHKFVWCSREVFSLSHLLDGYARLYVGLRAKLFVNKDKYCGGMDDKYAGWGLYRQGDKDESNDLLSFFGAINVSIDENAETVLIFLLLTSGDDERRRFFVVLSDDSILR